MSATITKNGLHFVQDTAGQFICQELVQLPSLFEERWSAQEVNADLDQIYRDVRELFLIRVDDEEEATRLGKDKRREMAAAVMDEVILSARGKQASLFFELLFAISDWWYYHPTVMEKLNWGDAMEKWRGRTVAEMVRKYLMPLLPEQVVRVVHGMQPLPTEFGFGHFALYFGDGDRHIRRIITDTQLIELHDVDGYAYLDLTPEGKPFIRCVTNRGGGRAFFDGYRLMAHNAFQTCAPKTVFFKDGYKVNSTRCSIVNGDLFRLIESDDKVAHTDGAFMGIVDFTRQDLIDSIASSEASAKRLRVTDGKVFLGERKLKPIGTFAPSPTSLLASGFTLIEWSEFTEIVSPAYDHVMVVDDRADWIGSIKDLLQGKVGRLDDVETTDRHLALQRVREINPEALILDVHLTADEQFDGLWIAKQLIADGFQGLIMLASSYRDSALEAMQRLVKGPVKAPGKNLERVWKCLCKKE